ncbi:MAG TPA: tetratricopeptide repeat protein [Planctomycetota bacterium]|nr:tetratricopeptide repeat protein [Planctomycetota bacterium]
MGSSSVEQGRGEVAWALASALLAAGLGAAAAGCAASPERVGRASLRTSERDVSPASARAASRAEDWRLAAARWNEVFLREGSVEACVETARALHQLGDDESARGILDMGLSRHPADPQILGMQGDVLARMGFRRAAEACLERALAADPDRPDVLLALGRVRLELERPSAAEAALSRRIELGFSDAETWLLRARARRAAGNVRGALEDYRSAFAHLDLSTEVRDLVSAGTLYVDPALRKDERARSLAHAWLERALERDPQCTTAWHHLGLIHEDLGDQEAAIRHHRRAAESDPAHLPSLAKLAELHSQRGELSAAADMARRACALEKDPARRAALERLTCPADPAPQPDGR